MRTRPLILGGALLAVAAFAGLRFAASGEDVPLEDIMQCRRPQVATPPPVATGAAVPARLTPVAAIEGAIGLAPLPRGANALVATRAGQLHRLDLGSGASEQVLDLTDRVLVGPEGGLLAVAVDPEGRFVYLHFTDHQATSRIVEYRLEEGAPTPGSEREVLAVEHAEGVHNGGAMRFGPDGALYLGFGNGGNRRSDVARGADPDRLDGKLLRIHPRPDGDRPYTVPDDNPFVGQDGVRPEIWATGLRNPWQFSFDGRTGELWIGDVGSSCYEEIDLLAAGEAGADLGFPRFEAFHAFTDDEADDATFPVHAYRHGSETCAVIGGVVNRAPGIPGLDGAYLFADFCGEGVQWLRRTSGGVEVGAVGVSAPRIQAFAEDTAGNVYVLSAEQGVLRLDPA